MGVRSSAVRGRVGRVVGVVTTAGVLALGGIALAAPASASAGCGAATAPPTPNTWVTADGRVVGTSVLSRQVIDGGYSQTVITKYQTVTATGSSKVEEWTSVGGRIPTRTSCSQTQPRTSGATQENAGNGGTGGSGGSSLGPGAWSGSGEWIKTTVTVRLQKK